MIRILVTVLGLLAFETPSLSQRIEWEDLPTTTFPIGPFRVVDDSTIYALKYFDWSGEPFTTPLFKSTDHGKSWDFSLPWGEVWLDTNKTGHHGVWALDIFFHDAAMGWASTNKGILATTDSGRTWTKSALGVLPSNGSRLLFFQSTDSIVIILHTRDSEFPRGLFSINRYTNEVDTLAWRIDLQRAKVDGVKSALILRDTLYVGGYAADEGTYLGIRPLSDTTWLTVAIDSSARLNPYLRIQNERVVFACGSLIYGLRRDQHLLDTIAAINSPIKELHILSSDESIVMHPSEPFVSISPNELVGWIPAGRPLLSYGTLTTHRNAFYHYRTDGSWLQRGQLVEGRELGLFLHPTRQSMMLKPLGGLDTLAGTLANYGDSNLRVHLEAKSGQLLQFSPSWIDVPARSEVDYTTIIRSVQLARDTARVSVTLSGHLHALGIWDLRVSETKTVKDDGKVVKFTIYPNPAKNVIKIDAQQPVFNVAISNALGRSTEVRRNGSTIDVSILPEGVYYLTCSTAQGTSSKAFVISR